MKFHGLAVFLFLIFSHLATAADFLVVEGRLFEADGITPIVAPNMDFTLEVHPPGGDCVIYSEVHSSLDMSASDGFFSLKLGAGGGPSGLAANFLDAMDNESPTNYSSCPFTPIATSSRDLKITYNSGSGPQTLSVPIEIGGSAFAMSLQGKRADDFIQVNSSGAVLTQANLELRFSKLL